ncbi:MAG: conjugal transfer protein TraB [Sphingopyxis sp.]|uniref:TrbI/VirB10 family protein n=1 Tax=Sphingopyxis sp. TaxID=1908224 RepID=UPI001A2282EC|nr:TrbI/VirB10 family protein [Sphingopyxis sp.]MBJ7499644.1 conjugal transfer protein TraB [Sphingopyxis sp.]
MSWKDFLGRRRAPTATDEVSPVAAELGSNDAVQRRQRLLLAGAGVVGIALSSFWIFSDGEEAETGGKEQSAEIKVSTSDMVNRNLSDREWMALSENRFQSTENQLRAVNAQQQRVDQLAQQVEQLRGANQSMAADGQRVLAAYEAENEQLRREVAQARSAPSPGPTALYGPGSPPTYQRPADGAPGAGGQAPAATRASEVKLVSFTPSAGGQATRAPVGNTVYSDSPNYLPPNSFATARVIVGVDASAGVRGQTDPLPVVLRVTGPARSVVDRGRLLTTSIEGCLINGAAHGDLSSEKVYVKLQRMTCPQPGGRFAVSEVKGFIAFAGKTGVRGRVVSREGSLVTQAFLAGLVGGFGRGFSANANSFFSGTNISTDGRREQLSTADILQGGLGEGVSQTGDMVSKYLIERAEQYQPVIEMPTGIDVEIVFLEGVYVRN